MGKAKVELHYDERGIINLIMDLLCAPEEWHGETVSGKLILQLEGKPENIQKAIWKWLMIPERYYTFMKLSDEDKKEIKDA